MAVGTLLGVAALGLWAADDVPAETPAGRVAPAGREGTVVPPHVASEPTEVPAAPATPPLADVGPLRLSLPSANVLLVGYHEASRRGALGLDPVGIGESNANTTRITLPPDDEDGIGYHVMSSRGRTPPPTSAVDLVLRDDDPVLAPVDGVVTEVRPYFLYGTYPDTRIEIQPDAAPDLRVVMIHVADVAVAEGDAVTVGDTALAGTANRFPFSSHIDRYLDERWPHVHMEVKDPAQADPAAD